MSEAVFTRSAGGDRADLAADQANVLQSQLYIGREKIHCKNV